MKVFVSTHCYSLGRERGHEGGMAELQRQLAAPDFDSLPCVRSIHRLRHLVDVELYADTGSTVIGKARARAFAAALNSTCDAWLTVDDDVEASSQTFGHLLAAVDDLAPRIVLGPCLLRRPGSAVANVELPTVRVERRLATGGLLLQCGGGGLALCAMNRAAMRAIVAAHPELTYVDDDQQSRWALWKDMLETDDRGHRRWLGEDLAFFRRMPDHVSIEALVTGDTVHAGEVLHLAQVAP